MSLTSAMEVAGPPGTGKTKTITELVRGILECTELDLIVLSERNGAIDAIASKLSGDCLRGQLRGKTSAPVVTDISLWTKILAFGSPGSIGTSTRLFTIKEKMRYHPELLQLRESLSDKRKAIETIGTRILKCLSLAIEQLEDNLPHGTNARERAKLIVGGHEAGLSPSYPLGIIHEVNETIEAIEEMISNGPHISEDDVTNVVIDHSSILCHLIPLDDSGTLSKLANPRGSIKRGIEALNKVKSVLKSLITRTEFSIEAIEKAEFAKRIAETSLQSAETRIESEMVVDARIMLCTIGSSHRLPVVDQDPEEDSLERSFAQMNLSEQRDTVVAFDEAGCIPSYELLGLSRLGRSIVSLVCVGDKHQLPPYSPSFDRWPKGSNRAMNRFAAKSQSRQVTTKVQSLLDASDIPTVKLTTQYRVPRDIANLLNARIYKGDYETAPECRAPLQGLQFVHVPNQRHRSDDSKKYINFEEIDECVSIIRKLQREGITSIMILTPYKKQQRQIQFILERETLNSEHLQVLTIDQCQGQEADYVILSLVQKPTRFLNKNRLNVALSRVRKKLYFLADRAAFQAASSDVNWECHLIAKDLLRMTAEYDDEDESDSFSDCW